MNNGPTTTDSASEPGGVVTIGGEVYVIVPKALFAELVSRARGSREGSPVEFPGPYAGNGGEGLTLGGERYVILPEGSTHSID